jgi:hypothetical protein
VVARPPLRAVPSLFDYDADEEENPFARRSSAGAWFLATAAAAGIFGAVLFGRVLLEASRAPSAVQASAPLAAAAEPEVRAAAPSPEAQSAPTVQALAPVAEVGAAARDSGARPAATSKKRSHTRRARHERRPRATSDDAGESPQRAKAQPRLSKNSSSAPALVEERDPPPANGIPALLRINSRPWSQIFVDGKLIGNTPQLAIQLVAGKHSVRLVNAEFGMTKTFTLKLAPGESVTRVETLQE